MLDILGGICLVELDLERIDGYPHSEPSGVPRFQGTPPHIPSFATTSASAPLGLRRNDDRSHTAYYHHHTSPTPPTRSKYSPSYPADSRRGRRKSKARRAISRTGTRYWLPIHPFVRGGLCTCFEVPVFSALHTGDFRGRANGGWRMICVWVVCGCVMGWGFPKRVIYWVGMATRRRGGHWTRNGLGRGFSCRVDDTV